MLSDMLRDLVLNCVSGGVCAPKIKAVPFMKQHMDSCLLKSLILPTTEGGIACILLREGKRVIFFVSPNKRLNKFLVLTVELRFCKII